MNKKLAKLIRTLGLVPPVVKFVISLLLAFGAGLGFPDMLNPFDYPVASLTAHELAQKNSVIVESDDSFGTGVVIKRQNEDGKTRFFVWTAAHVVEGTASVKVLVQHRSESQIVGATAYRAKVLRLHSEKDIALLHVEAPADAFPGVEFDADTPPPVGTSIYHVGNFRGLNFVGSVATGVLSQVGVEPRLEEWPWGVVDQTTVPAFSGSSGGAMFNAENDRVLGLCVGGVNAVLNVYVPVREIAAWAKSNSLLWAVRGQRCPPDSWLSAQK